ncbi:hypothetical protein B0J14DRAFT_486400 [Halenospora varia]|nr:hypothetical protein B0J14DRAFT_486400 [Halenospora varia]
MSDIGEKEEYFTNNKTLTPYIEMYTQANKMPSIYNILAALFSWLILAGFVVLLGTFTSLKHSTILGSSKGREIVQKTIQNVLLLLMAGVMCGIGIYVWLTRQIFLPGLLNLLVGLLTILVNVITTHNNHWSITAKITLIVSGICTGSMFMLFLVYSWLLEKVKTLKDREVARRKKPKGEKEVL